MATNEDASLLDDDKTLEKENITEPIPKKPRGWPPKTSVLDETVNLPNVAELIKKDGMIRELHSKIDFNTIELRRKDDTIRDLLTQIDAAKEEINMLRDDNDAKDEAIKCFKKCLDQKDRDYLDLLEQLDAMDVPASSASAMGTRAKVFIVVDEVTEILVPLLTDKFEWHSISNNELMKDLTSLPDKCDAIFFLTGSSDLCGGQNWNSLVTNLTQMMTQIRELGLPVYSIHLPPADKKNMSSKISLVNYKMDKQASINVIATDTSGISKSKLLTDDGIHLSAQGADAYSDLINRNLLDLTIHKSDRNPRKSTSQTTDIPDIKLFVEIKVDAIGKIIGKGGHVVKKLSTDHNVSINIGKWFEKIRSTDEHKEICDSVLIKGNMDNALMARETINKICVSK